MRKNFFPLIIGLMFLLGSLGLISLQVGYGGYGMGKGGKGSKIISVKISPKSATVKVGKTKKFTAVVQGRGKIDRSVDWSVDGEDVNGTFITTGKKQATYKAPDTVPAGGKVTIRATSNGDPSISGRATVTIKGGGSTTTSTTTTTTSTATTITVPQVTPGSQVNNTITIQDFAFSPVNIGVVTGTTITVKNKDSFGHSVTSQAKAGDFTSGSVSGVSFDTGVFITSDKTFTIPSTAVSGTVIPYFCTLHKSSMATKNGYVTVQ